MSGHMIDQHSTPQAAPSGPVVLAVGRLVAVRPAAATTCPTARTTPPAHTIRNGFITA